MLVLNTQSQPQTANPMPATTSQVIPKVVMLWMMPRIRGRAREHGVQSKHYHNLIG